MSVENILLTVAALLPAIVLCVYVYKKDRVEKEPIGLLLGLFALGALSCFPAGMLEEIICPAITNFFTNFATVYNGEYYLDSFVIDIYNFVYMLFGVALVEEGLKFLILFFVTRNNKNFNCVFDGIIYAVFVSLGFAALENVFYVLENGWVNAATRAILSVPGHMFFSVMMGYYYSTWRVTKQAAALESGLINSGIVPASATRYNPTRPLVLALIIPMLMHGFYNFCCVSEGWFWLIALIVFVIGMYVYCFSKIREMSKIDALDTLYSYSWIFKKYPYLADIIAKYREAQNGNGGQNF